MATASSASPSPRPRSPWARACAPLLLLLALAPARAQELPERVRVLPVAFYAKDQAEPAPELLALYATHLAWAQRRYRELLGGATFALARRSPDVVRGRWPLLAYRQLPEDGAPQITSELLAHYRTDRFRCPWVFAVLFVNPCENQPAGGGRPLNGGRNRGGGVLLVSSWGLGGQTSFQSTLQHELGHAFGLPHVDAYGDDMRRSRSLMSYDRRHHTRGLTPSKTPGGLIAEDRWALAQNQRVFPGLRFITLRDQRPGQRRRPPVDLGPMTIPGQPPWGRPAGPKAPRLRPSAPRGGYELFVDGERVRRERWSRAKAQADLRRARARRPKARVQARYDGLPLE